MKQSDASQGKKGEDGYADDQRKSLTTSDYKRWLLQRNNNI